MTQHDTRRSGTFTAMRRVITSSAIVLASLFASGQAAAAKGVDYTLIEQTAQEALFTRLPMSCSHRAVGAADGSIVGSSLCVRSTDVARIGARRPVVVACTWVADVEATSVACFRA